MSSRTAVAAALVLALCGAGMAETHVVSDYGTLKALLEERAEPGDVIEIQPGVIYTEAARILVQRSGTPEKPIIVRGVVENGQRPIIDGSRVSTNRGMFFFPPETHDYIIENLELRHAIGTRHLYAGTQEDRAETYRHNAAAMYFQGHNITVRNCYSHHNEDGFFANRDADYILIEDCEISWNGTLWPESHAPTHNFYFCAKHQMVKNSYLHNPRDGENFKSRGQNTIFAFNWADEDFAYCIEQSSGGGLNTLWLGNVVAKRTTEGLWQGRLFAIGDGTGEVSGKVVAVNNTFVSVFPRDYFLFSFATGTADIVLINNIFAGPAEVFAAHNGQGTVTGTNNWIRSGIKNVPEGLVNTIYGDDPGVEDLQAFRLRPAGGSPLIDAGADAAAYAEAIAMALAHAESGSDVRPSPPYLKALAEVGAALPGYEPVRKGKGFETRQVKGALDIGAFEAR